MTLPMHRPFDRVRHHVRTHRQGYENATVLLGTVLFLVGGAFIALSQLPPGLR